MKPTTLLLCILACVCSAGAKSPNVVIFLTDDMGWGDLACYGHPVIKSPNLDRFAGEGVRFTQCYSACGVCSPSRSSVLTGRTPYRNGVWRWIPSGHYTHLRESEVTLPELLKTKGYATCHVGKWHLNGHFNKETQPQPNDHGYDHWMATQNNAAPSHKNPTNFVLNGKAMGRLEGFSAPLVAGEAIRWLADVRDKTKPFLLSVWTHEPHLPIESSPEFMAPYSNIADDGIRQHHGNITQIDHAFGMLMKGLKELGLHDDTIVFFTSDNGPEGNGRSGRTRGSTGGLRGRKRDSHEGGIRVPGMVRWPGHIDPGTVSTVPVIGSDIFSTVAGIVDIPLPDNRTIDGTDIRPAFKGQPVNRAVPLFWRTHIAPEKSHAAMRIGAWKIVADRSLSEFQLYEIEKDPKELNDLAGKQPAKLAVMKAKFLEVWRGIEAEGPREWWQKEQPRKKQNRGKAKPKKAGKLSDGNDQSGDWPIVRGGSVTKSESSYRLTSAGEAFALRPLDPPLTDKSRAVFKLNYQSAVSTTTRNALFCFGQKAVNDHLIKAGSMIGMNSHGIFEGNWANVKSGTLEQAKFDQTQKFTVRITVDLGKRLAVLETGMCRLEKELPDTLDAVNFFGIYTKATATDFSDIEIER